MDIFKFIKSKAVKQYIKDIKYEFSSLECAYIVYVSEVPLKTKLKAWREIVDTLPDCQIPASKCYEEISVHKHLSELIDCYTFLLKQFNRKSVGAFSYSFYDNLNNIGIESDEPLDSYRSALDMAKSDIEHSNAKVYNELYIEKNCFDLACILSLRTDIKGQIFDISLPGELEGQLKEYADILMLLECVQVKIPTPFKKGDILHTPYGECHFKFVLSDCDRAEGYHICCGDTATFKLLFFNLHDAEYLENYIADKRLQLISDYLKGKIKLSQLLYLVKKEFLDKENRNWKEKAVKYFSLFAKEGNADAQCSLGECYYKGWGVKEDRAVAKKWLTLAADQNNERAITLLKNFFD